MCVRFGLLSFFLFVFWSWGFRLGGLVRRGFGKESGRVFGGIGKVVLGEI